MKYFFATCLALFLFTGLPAQGYEPDCDDPRTQMDMNECAQREFKAADQALNVAYKKLMALVDDDLEAKIRQAQRTWVKFRDESCECERFLYDGGSISPLIWANCRTRATQQRTEELNSLLDQLDM
ncbi:MAG: lysozyme inhibitor LprI family protein [Bacteroidota bacterium]